MADPTYPTKKNNPPPILEGGHDELIGEPFEFMSEMIEDIHAILQPTSSATVGTLTEVVLGDDRAPYTSLAGIVLAVCRIQTGVSLLNATNYSGVNLGNTYSANVQTQFCHFQEGKFSIPPFVYIQPFGTDIKVSSGSMEAYHEPIMVDRVTTAGFRASSVAADSQDTTNFFWLAVQPPFGWKSDLKFGARIFPSVVENDPSTPAWRDTI